MAISTKYSNQSSVIKPAPPEGLSRRGFLGGLGAAATAAGLGTLGGATMLPAGAAAAAEIGPVGGQQRRQQAFEQRHFAALRQKRVPLPGHPTNGDDDRYTDYRGSYTKGLPHNSLGEVDPSAYELFLAALASGDSADFEAIPLAGPRKLANPQAAYAFEMVGPDSHHLGMIAPAALTSAWEAAEGAEVYWRALARDVRFTDYGSDALIAEAAADLSTFTDYRGPKEGGMVTSRTLFRGSTPGDLTGPLLSQFLWQTVPYGPTSIEQRYVMIADGDDRMTSYGDWLDVQNGFVPPPAANILDPTPRYIRQGRDLAQYVHFDFSYQAFLNAALILLGMGAADPNNPYNSSTTQGGFITFGGPFVLDLVAKAARAGLAAAWYQKWQVHRRLRPEAFAGLVHNQVTGAKSYGLHSQILASAALPRVFDQHGTYLLPMAYAEGSPTHPSYPAGHATIAGACTTILKAFFNEGFVIPNPVQASRDGDALDPWTGGDLTVGGELNKLAHNIALGRDTAGVHWRADGTEGIRLGEQVALGILLDYRQSYNEPFAGFALTLFDGTPVLV